MENYEMEDNVSVKSVKPKKDFYAYHKTKNKELDLRRKNARKNKNRW